MSYTQGLHDSTAHLPEADTLARAAHHAHIVFKKARQQGVRSQLCVLIQLLPEAPDCAQRFVKSMFVLGSPTMHSSVI